MSDAHEYQHLSVQEMPNGGLVVRFKRSRISETEHVQQARDELLSLVSPERILLIDFTNVEYLSSPVIGALLNVQRELEKLAGTISLCGLSPQFDELFRVLRLDRLFEIYPDLESALDGSADSEW
jgi:anti-sigma B factor antagonist